MLISNAYAGSVSRGVKEVIAKALQADFKLEAVDTEGRGHATELARDAADRGFAAVIAFGGDGTINEAAQGLVGTGLSFGFIPGGSTNVVARSLGVPRDPIEATAFVASHLRSGTTRTINVGCLDAGAGDRYFLFCAGIGFDAEVVKRVEADPAAKRRWGEWFFLSNALRAGAGEYRKQPPAITIEVPGRAARKVALAICCNGRPFTFFKRFPVDVCPEARLDAGLDLFGLERIRLVTIPRIAWGVLVSRSHVGWRSTFYSSDLAEASVSCERPLPLQVDGDYLGEVEKVSLSVRTDALRLLV